jgi:hypothetical protein
VYIIVLSAVVCHQWRVTIILMCSYQTVHNSASLACTTVLFTANTATAITTLHTGSAQGSQARRQARSVRDSGSREEKGAGKST